ncbi:MAG TPA: class I SAM-dependent methyltransferase [Phototrophicaceae bacterium]|jgi:SAM-dependent methyltransferase|nr:class I SAM-dependent methyltransferase [Phototrophicaceae bacterium]
MAFDILAPDYDPAFTTTQIGRWLRGRVHARLNTLYHAGYQVLELGCGTGEDARHLAAQGIHITATDASPEMLKVAAAKNTQTPLATFAPLNLAALPDNDFTGLYDGVFASFGVLNCIPDWKPLAAWLAARVRPGGKIAFGIMSPYCVWEIMWHGAHLHLRTATRRLRKSAPFQINNSEVMPIYYPTPRRIRRDFAPHFRSTHLEGLGLFLPPSDAFGVIEKRPRLLKTLTLVDHHTSRMRWLAAMADHYWIEFERV